MQIIVLLGPQLFPAWSRLWACVAAAALLGCATPYQSAGFAGGFTETQLDYNVFRVSFHGNGFTTPERVDDLTLLRSAQLSLANGYGYFAIVDGSRRVDKAAVVTPTVGQTNLSARRITTTLIGGIPLVIEKPSATNTIFCFEERPTEGFTYDAKFLVGSISRKYGLTNVPAPMGANAAAVAQPSANAGAALQPSVNTVAASRPGAPTDQQIPYLSKRHQPEWNRYMASPNPKAFAISDNGHYAWASGAGGKATVHRDPKMRALERCAEFASKECVLYAVDDTITFQMPQ